MREIVCHLWSSLPKKMKNKFQFLPRNLIEDGGTKAWGVREAITKNSVRSPTLAQGELTWKGPCVKTSQAQSGKGTSCLPLTHKHMYWHKQAHGVSRVACEKEPLLRRDFGMGPMPTTLNWQPELIKYEVSVWASLPDKSSFKTQLLRASYWTFLSFDVLIHEMGIITEPRHLMGLWGLNVIMHVKCLAQMKHLMGTGVVVVRAVVCRKLEMIRSTTQWSGRPG